LTIIDRINNCLTATLRNQLLLVFARLVHEYGDVQIIEFLAKQNKLKNILTFWCSNHNDFIYPYYKKISVTALAKILQTNHKLISNLSFDGYPIINIHAPRSMRSRSQRLQYTQMPFVVKFFQILVDTFRDLVDCHDVDDEDTDCVDEEEEDDEDNDGEDIDEQQQSDEEEEDEEEYVPEESGEESESEYDEDNESDLTENDELAMIQRKNQQQHHPKENQGLLRHKKPANALQKANAARNTELNLCPEAVSDRIFNMDFEKWSKEFTHNMSNQHGSAFQRVISMLNESDKNILKKILN